MNTRLAAAALAVALAASSGHAAPRRAVARPAPAGSVTPTIPRSTAAVPPAKALPVFDFQGQNTDAEYETPITSDSGGCHPESATTIECAQYLGAKLAGEDLDWLTKRYHAKRLYMVSAVFNDGAYSTIQQALVAKYGAPTSTASKKWQSQGGATFDNVVSTWVFKGGALELNSIGHKVGKSSFDFVSGANAPAPEKPKVDF